MEREEREGLEGGGIGFYSRSEEREEEVEGVNMPLVTQLNRGCFTAARATAAATTVGYEVTMRGR